MMFLFLHPNAAATSAAAQNRHAPEKRCDRNENNTAFRTESCSRSAESNFAGEGARSVLSAES